MEYGTNHINSRGAPKVTGIIGSCRVLGVPQLGLSGAGTA